MLHHLASDNELFIFTTNYDRVIEEYCRHQSIPYIDGFARDPTAEEFEWNPVEFEKKQQGIDSIKLFKLHGSLNWRRRIDGVPVKIGTEEKTRRDSKRFHENILIYPGEKSEPHTEPFITLHKLFQKYFLDSDVCVFIGFAFRDEYLNSIIAQGLRKKKVVIVDLIAIKIRGNLIEEWSPRLKLHRIVCVDGPFGELSTTNKIEEAILKKGTFIRSRKNQS